MAPFYKIMVEELQAPFDQALYDSMVAKNEEELKKFDDKAVDAEQNQGETEINEAFLSKADYYAKIGDKENALTAYENLLKRSITLGTRIDIVFTFVRIGFFFNDNSLVRPNIEKLRELIEQGGDWDRRNRLKVYEGVYLMSIRDFKGAASLFLDTLSTFTSTEIMSYQDFVKYAVLTSLISMKRVDIKKRVLDAPEILEVISDIPHLEDFMASLYNCKYAQFFRSLAAIEQAHLRTSRYLLPHMRYYIREMRIQAYAQLLESYRSLTVTSMAQAFGMSEEYIDKDLYKFIAAGRLNCVIDKVNGIIETNRPDAKNAQYQAVIKQGDLLLNRVQKLSRVIDV
ncbi:26S proteasome subunit RPN7-domain-containing protein [Mucor lusitanicus]|nr:26S proteasome subunit RPN7-domain-containing protein [Mucor lusitanicus]